MSQLTQILMYSERYARHLVTRACGQLHHTFAPFQKKITRTVFDCCYFTRYT